VQRLHWRLIAEMFWTDDVRGLYGAPALKSKDARANARHTKGRMAAKEIHDYLFPED
jgi:hypothetical protein